MPRRAEARRARKSSRRLFSKRKSSLTDQTHASVQISEKELNEKVMKKLHERAACSDARSVMLYLVKDENAPDNWQIGHFDPGNGDRYKCKLALRSIFASMSGTYFMVGES